MKYLIFFLVFLISSLPVFPETETTTPTEAKTKEPKPFTIPTKEEIAKFKYEPSPKNYKKLFKEKVGEDLKDPWSAKYKISKPKKAWTKTRKEKKEGEWEEVINLFWAICGEVNSKNTFGGYTGFERMYVGIKNGKILRKIEPPNSDWNMGESYRSYTPNYCPD